MISYETPLDLEPWQKRLNDLFPPNEEISHLKIVWEPGYDWDRLGRFILYQMLPPARVPVLVQPWLEGPDPRDFTYYDETKKEVVRRRGAPLISHQQWRLYRETGGYYGMPYWVVQGDSGGHKIKFTKAERMIARIKGHPTGEPPRIGELPYAPFDERVIEKLIKVDEMRTYNLLVDFSMRSPEQLERDEERGAEEAKERLWSWIESQVGKWIDELPHGGVERIAGLDRPVRIFT